MRSFPFAALLLFSLTPVLASAQHAKCEPCWHAFGKVAIGDTVAYSIVLANRGTETLKIKSVSEAGSAFKLGSFPVPVDVDPGSTVELPINFTPTEQGEIHGTITVSSNDPQSPLSVHVLGTGITASGRQLTVSPSTLNFGNVSVGSSATLQATLTASGGIVTLSSDKTNSSEFVILSPALPVRIPSGSSVEATIQFTPNTSGTASAQAGYFSNADDSPAMEQLSGTGTTSGSHEAYLSWDAGAPNITGYNVYRSNVHGGPYSQVNPSLDVATNYTDYSVTGGDTYYYVATEVNTEGQESGYSNEVKVKIPKD